MAPDCRCGYCNKQRVLFGTQGASLLPYVECDPEGYHANPTLCGTQGIRSYPSWLIKVITTDSHQDECHRFPLFPTDYHRLPLITTDYH